MKPLHFEPEPDWDSAKAKAVEAFESETKPCRLVCSIHWASEGYWIEFPPYKSLDTMDSVMRERT